MIKIPRDYIIEKIKEKSGLSSQEINDKIKAKLEELSGLISEDGAAHIIANELGIKIMEAQEALSIKDIFAGMRNIELVGKVTRVFEVRTFNTPQRSGKVGSFMIADATGQTRIVAWGNQADVLSKLKEGDVVRVKSGYAKENQGKIEVNLNDNSQIIINPEGVTIGDVKTRENSQRKKISELSNNDQNVEVLGTVVQAFDPRYFEVCPTCTKRIKNQGLVFKCDAHGEIASPDYSYVMNAIIDDGSETIRTIFFRNQMQHLTNLTHDEIINRKGGSFEEIKNDLLGKIIKVIGRVSTNEMFSRIELVAQVVDSNPNASEELKRIEAEKPVAAKIEIVKPAVQKTEAPKQVEKKQVFEAPKPIPKKEISEDIIRLDDIESVDDDDDIYE